MGWKDDLSEEKMMDLNMSLLKTCESWNTKGNYQEWHNTTSKDEIERTTLRMQDEECLNSSKQNMCWAPCLFWSMAWRIITSREILKNNSRMKGILDEPSCRASMKNSGNKRMIKRKETEVENPRWRLAMIRWIFTMI